MKHRIFIAINLPEDIKNELAGYEKKWPELPARWTGKNNLHITVEFLGELADEELVEVCKITNEVAGRHKAFSINLQNIKQVPKMIGAEGEKDDNLKDLKADLQECLLEEIRFRPEGRGFTPHITMARIREWEFRQMEPEERPEINEEISLTFTVESIDIMESELKRGGPVYTILESCLLQ